MWKPLYTAWALSEGQCGILTMIDSLILAILYERKIFENVESPGFVSRTVWNINDDRYSNFGHCYEEQIFENVETSLYSPGFVSRTVWNINDDRYSNFGHFYKTKSCYFALFLWRCFHISRFWSFFEMRNRLYIETIPHFLILPFFFLNVQTSL